MTMTYQWTHRSQPGVAWRWHEFTCDGVGCGFTMLGNDYGIGVDWMRLHVEHCTATPPPPLQGPVDPRPPWLVERAALREFERMRKIELAEMERRGELESWSAGTWTGVGG